jgi:hypothetical protein
MWLIRWSKMEKLNMTLHMTLEEIKEELRKRIIEAHVMASMDNGYTTVGPHLGALLDGMAGGRC